MKFIEDFKQITLRPVPMAACLAVVSLTALPGIAAAQWVGPGSGAVDWRLVPSPIPGVPVPPAPVYPQAFPPDYAYYPVRPLPAYDYSGFNNGYAEGYLQGYGNGFAGGYSNGFVGAYGNGFAGGYGNGYPGMEYRGYARPYPY